MAITRSTVYGCGLDIEEVKRFNKFIKKNDCSLMGNICSRRELDNFHGKYIDKRIRLALSFSFKEAFYKALGKIWVNSDICWKDIEILFKSPDFSDYRIILRKTAEDILFNNNINLAEVYFTYNKEYVVFQIILLNNACPGIHKLQHFQWMKNAEVILPE
jgi:phosphopantetheine--protein transferase-like protein